MDNEFKQLFTKTVILENRWRKCLEMLKEKAFKERKVYTHPFVEEIKEYLSNTDGAVWDVLPHCVNIVDKYNESHEICIYRVEMKDSLIYVTGCCDGCFNERMYVSEGDDRLWTVLNMIFDVMSIEDKQKRNFKAGEKVLRHCYEENDNTQDDWMWVVDETAVSLPDDKIKLKDAEGKVTEYAAKSIYKISTDHKCPYCKHDDSLLVNHFEAVDSWYCTDCGHYIYPWDYQNYSPR